MTTPTIFIIINVPRVTKPDRFFVMVDYNLKLKIVILNDEFSNGSDIFPFIISYSITDKTFTGLDYG